MIYKILGRDILNTKYNAHNFIIEELIKAGAPIQKIKIRTDCAVRDYIEGVDYKITGEIKQVEIKMDGTHIFEWESE